MPSKKAKKAPKAEQTETMSLYRKHRPTSLDEVIGQESAVQVLSSKFQSGNIPHCLLFTGPSGCGKTTLARIVKEELQCSDVDFTELNSADFRGIDMVRDIRTRIPLAPIGGKCRVWLIDEAHQLTKDAQTALLKMMEDTPSHVYFMIATTESGKLLPAIVNRCVSIKVKKLKNKEIADVLMQVCRKEWNTDAGEKFTDEVLDKVVELSEGCPRAAVQLLESVVDVEDADSQVECLERSEFKSESIELCRALLNERNRWPEVAALLKGLDVDPEKMRRMVLGYMTSVILGGKNAKRAFLVIQAFRDNFFDSGKAGLVAACYEVVVGG